MLNEDEGSVGSSIPITGSGFNRNEIVTVNYDGTTVLSGVGTDYNGSFVTRFTVPQSHSGAHTVTVSDAGGASASTVFIVETQPPPTPQLISPTAGRTVRTGAVDFQWHGVTDVSGVYYTLEVSSSADFATVVLTRSGIVEPSYTLSKQEALPKGGYYWRVKAIDGAGNQGEWTSPGSFTVAPRSVWIWIIVAIVVIGVIIGVAYKVTKFRV